MDHKQKVIEQANIMLAFANGAKLQCRSLGSSGEWVSCGPTNFNFSMLEYRVAPPAIAPGHNPDNITVQMIFAGMRLLDEDEIRDGPGLLEIYEWKGMAWFYGVDGSNKSSTYATSLTREQLAEKRGLLKPKPKINLMQNMDARVWAIEWLDTIKRNPNIPTDEGTMITWFSSAIMCGYDEAVRRSKDRADRRDAMVLSQLHGAIAKINGPEDQP